MNYCGKAGKIRVWAGIISAALCLGAVSPGVWAAAQSGTQSTLTANQAATPQGAVQLVMESLKALDMKAFNAYTDNIREEKGGKYITMFGDAQEELTDEDKALELEMVRMLSWKVGTVTVTGDSALVNMEITNADFSRVIGGIMSDSMKEAFKSAPDYEKIEKQMVDRLKEAQKSTITLECAVTLKKAGGIWKVHLDEAFVNAVCGNLLAGMAQYMDGMGAILWNFSNTAADGTASAVGDSIDGWMNFGLGAAREALRDQDLQAEIEKEIRDALADADIKGEIQRALGEAFQ